MIAVEFAEANAKFGPPSDMEESQVQTVAAYLGQIKGGSVDGSNVIITAWRPTEQELADLNAGKCVYISILSPTLPPHLLTTNFQEAIQPA